MVWAGVVNKPCRLLGVDFLVEDAVEECVVDVELVDRLAA